jgi:uracil-DNA glycosylase family 4
MEQRYKEALRNLQKANLTKAKGREYRDRLFPVTWSYRAVEALPKVSVSPEPESEKAKIIESLKDFSENLISLNNNKSVTFDNIEISAKASVAHFDNPELLTQAKVESLSSKSSFMVRYGDKLQSDKQVDVIFVSDNLLDIDLSVEDELGQFKALFDESTAVLFSKMVGAMKLQDSNFLLTAIAFDKDKTGTDLTELVLSEITHFKPKLVITLGVSASHGLIDTKERLKDLHGNFYPLTVGNFSSEIMPLFSPSLLNSAPHMKSITWVDMQKAMEKLA